MFPDSKETFQRKKNFTSADAEAIQAYVNLQKAGMQYEASEVLRSITDYERKIVTTKEFDDCARVVIAAYEIASQAQSGQNFTVITYSGTEPTQKKVGDIWLDPV